MGNRVRAYASHPALILLLAGTSLAAGLPAPLAAADPFLLADIRTDGASNRGSAPHDFRRLGEVVVFQATDPDHGEELWASDGTADGTERIADICPHLCSSEIDFLWASEGLLYFNAVSEEAPSGAPEEEQALRRLWRTDGTAEGTVPLGDVRGVEGMGRAVGAGVEVFVGDDEHGREPWATDGTAAGTRLLRDLAPGPADSSDVYFSAAAGGAHVLFSADVPEVGYELWRTDGTTQGTALVRDIRPGAGSSFPTNLEPLSDAAVFIAADEEHGAELWRSDGTRAGTRVVRDLVPGSGGTGFLEFPGRAFFLDSKRAFFPAWTETAAVGEGPPEGLPLLQLWVTDGTAGGTEQLTAFVSPYALRKDLFDPDLPYYTSLFMGSAEGAVFFAADGGIGGRELWVTDGTPAGTRQVTDICPGPCSSHPVFLRGFGPAVSFEARTPGQIDELFVSDGTADGTGMVADVCPGTCGPFVNFREPFDGGLLFGATLFGEHGGRPELWRTGAAPGTGERIGSWEPPGATFAMPPGFRVASTPGGEALFGLNDGDHGHEPWVTRGTAASTRLLEDLVGEANFGSGPRQLTSVADRVFFVASGNEDSTELWLTDGSEAGTRKVEELFPFTSNRSEPDGPTAIGGALYFWRKPPDDVFGEDELWRSDGTPAGTERVAVVPGHQPPVVEIGGRIFAASDAALWRIDPVAGTAERIEELEVIASTLISWREELYFLARRPEPGARLGLWKTDGTSGGAQALLDPASGPEATAFARPTVVGDTLFFGAEDSLHGRELWATDGAPEGTRLVVDLVPGVDSRTPTHLRASSGGLVFTQDDPEKGPGLWRSDGTPEGTVLLRRFVAREGFPDVAFAEELGGAVLFAADDGVHGNELWQTDGTVAGTRLVADLEPGPEGAGFRDVTVIGDSAYFAAFTRAHGRQLWRSDATPGGTVRLTDRSSGVALGRQGTPVAPAGEVIVFAAGTPRLGSELWGLRTDDEPAGPPVEPPPPDGPWLQAPGVPGFRFKVRIEQGPGSSISGSPETACIPETLCVSGALPGRSEVFVRVVGPKPNGRLWPTLVKFTTSGVDVWIEQVATGLVRHYRLDGVGPGDSELTGLFDRTGFLP